MGYLDATYEPVEHVYKTVYPDTNIVRYPQIDAFENRIENEDLKLEVFGIADGTTNTKCMLCCGRKSRGVLRGFANRPERQSIILLHMQF